MVAVREHSVADAGRAAARHKAGGVAVSVHQIEHHRDDLALEARLARAHVALQRVDVREESERLVHEGVVVVVAAVDRPRALAGLPEGILLGRDGTQLGDDVVVRTAVLGQATVDVEAVRVRIEVAHPARERWGRGCAASSDRV